MFIVLMVAFLMVLVGGALLISGIQTRREDGPADGTVAMAIGAPVLAMGLVLGLAVSLVDFTDDATSDETTAATETPEDVLYTIDGAAKYLRSIEDLQLTFDGSVGPKMNFAFTGDDVSGQIQTESGKVDLLRVGGETYMRPEDKFFGSDGKAAVDLIDERWLHVDLGNEILGALVPFADRERLRLVLNERQRFVRIDKKRIGSVNSSGFKAKLTNATIYIDEGASQKKLIQIVYSDGSVGNIAYGDSGRAPVKPSRVVEIDNIFPPEDAA